MEKALTYFFFTSRLTSNGQRGRFSRTEEEKGHFENENKQINKDLNLILKIKFCFTFEIISSLLFYPRNPFLSSRGQCYEIIFMH